MRKRVNEVAKELNLTNKELLQRFNDLGVPVKSHSSMVEDKDIEALKQSLSKAKSREEGRPKTILRKKKDTASQAPETQQQTSVPRQVTTEAGEARPLEKEHAETKRTQPVTEVTPDVRSSPTPEHPSAAETASEAEKRTVVHEQPVSPIRQGEKAQAPHEKSSDHRPPEQAEQAAAAQHPPQPQAAKTQQEAAGAKKQEKPALETADSGIKTKLKSEKGGAFIKKKILSKIKTDMAEEIDLLEENKEDETILQNVVTYTKKTSPQHRQRHERAPDAGTRQPATAPKQKKAVRIEDRMTVSALSQVMGVKATEIIKRLIALGIMAGINDVIDAETSSLIVKDIGFEVSMKQEPSPEALLNEAADPPEKLRLRPPVVTVMGHVDHGKTTLLDAIRASKVAEGEVGGITQHIGAYTVNIDKKQIVFLDTPGHEAFTEMRARGAKVTDIVVLVVAADDGVMPQTIEAIDHAKAAGVPMLVAINKIDKPEAQPQKVMQQLSDQGLVPEQWGGNTLYAMISAKKKTGINELLELILLQSEIMELKVNPDKRAKVTLIETRMDRGFGVIATGIVREGTLKKGDYIIYGPNYNRVKTLLNDSGNVITSAGPSMPVEIIGFESLPEVGDVIFAVEEEETARKVRDHRISQQQLVPAAKKVKVSLEDIYKKIEEGSIKELPVLLKCDVMGSLGAIRDAVGGLTHQDVKVRIIHSGIGGINESDVMLAAASEGIIIGFNVRPDAKAVQLAGTNNIEIKTYNIIYDLIEDIKKALTGLLKPVIKEKAIGRARVLEIFKISKVGVIAGSMVVDGKIERGANVRIIREGVVVYESKIGSLKRFKEDVRDVDKGFECGIGIEKFNDLKKNDELEVFRMEKEEIAS